tara:strand:- start:201 stop:614 length:414 start_codon:yes stop_codon:yes gene_type:complete
MPELSSFLVQQSAITVPMALMAIGLIVVEWRLKQAHSSEVDPERAIELVNRQKGIVVDLRQKSAYESGHIGGALNLEASQLGARTLGKYKQRPVILVAENNKAAKTARADLLAAGFESAFVLVGGIENWRRQGLPVV